MKGAAVRIHDLAKQLGVQKARVVGHDIGLMVALCLVAVINFIPAGSRG